MQVGSTAGFIPKDSVERLNEQQPFDIPLAGHLTHLRTIPTVTVSLQGDISGDRDWFAPTHRCLRPSLARSGLENCAAAGRDTNRIPANPDLPPPDQIAAARPT